MVVDDIRPKKGDLSEDVAPLRPPNLDKDIQRSKHYASSKCILVDALIGINQQEILKAMDPMQHARMKRQFLTYID